MNPFDTLGNVIATRWAEGNYQEETFIEIATTELEKSKLLTAVEPKHIISWLMNSALPEQKINNFGQPPVRVFTGKGFYIEVLFWIDGTTSIHEHAFIGTFGVLHGSSVQSTYRFTPERQASERLIVGKTQFLDCELLRQGDARPIHSGDGLIHSLFHLDRPSVSVVIRTSSKLSNARPQYHYLKPFLAVYDIDRPSMMVIQSQMLESLARTDVTAFWTAAHEIVSNCDPFMLFQVLYTAFRFSNDTEKWNALLGAVQRENRWLLEPMLPCLIEQDRAKKIGSLRASIHDPQHRFFLALLLNVPSRKELYRLISERFPGNRSDDMIVEWLAAIFNEKRAGIKLNPAMICLVKNMLRGSDFEGCLPTLRNSFKFDSDSDEELLRRCWERLESVDILKPLLSGSESGIAVGGSCCRPEQSSMQEYADRPFSLWPSCRTIS